MNFEEAIDFFKAKEDPGEVLILLGKEPSAQALRKIIIAWPKCKITISGREYKQDDDKELWEDIWSDIKFSSEWLREASDTHDSFERYFTVLKSNRLIYPDGTVAKYARLTIQQIVKGELGW